MSALAGAADVFYCTREDVKQALDVQETARSNRQIDRTIKSRSRAIEAQMGRIFYPLVTSRTFDWPPLPYSGVFPWRMWLDQHEVITVSSLVSGGVTIPATDYLLEPVNDGPPYSHIDINLGTSSALAAGSTWQQSTTVTGVFGYTTDTEDAGTLAAAISSTTATSLTLSATATVGVGTILAVGSERMLVTERAMASTGQTLQSALTASMADVTVAVTDGTAYVVDEVLLLDSERMLIVDIAGNALTVKRAWDGSVLAAHTSPTVYALRQCTIVRGALGTTAATHSSAAAVSAHVVPTTIRSLCVAESITELLAEESGYARTIGSGDNTRNASLAGLKDLRAQAFTAYGRSARIRAV